VSRVRIIQQKYFKIFRTRHNKCCILLENSPPDEHVHCFVLNFVLSFAGELCNDSLEMAVYRG